MATDDSTGQRPDDGSTHDNGPSTGTTSTTSTTSTAGTAGTGSARFFGWMRGLGIVRGNGWLGGVCGGVAARLGIDPLIVRGIVVVIAILGGPAFLLYAAAWLLLPDAQNDIHLERMIKGQLEPALIGIAVLVLFSLLPFAQGFWWAGAQFWGDGSVIASIGRTLWTLLIIAAIVAVVIWAARTGRFSSRGDGDSRTASASAAAPGSAPGASGTAPASASTSGPIPETAPTRTSWFTGTPVAGYGAPGTAGGEPIAPAAPEASATPDELTAWRQRQDAWKAEHAAWRAQRAADERAIRQQRAAENLARSRELAAQAAEARRLRRLANPRTSAGYVGIALGVALLAGGVGSGIALGSAEVSRFALTIGLAVATVAVGLSIVVAGAMRRRSGFLSFIGMLLVAASIVCALLTPPQGRDFAWPAASYVNPAAVHSYQPVGSTTITLDDRLTHHDAPIDVHQGVGSTDVWIGGDLTVRVIVTQHDGRSAVSADDVDSEGNATPVDATRHPLADGAMRSVVTLGDNATLDATVHVEQSVGSVHVERYGTAPSTPSAAPTPTATSRK